MNIQYLNDTVTVSGQLTAADIGELKGLEITTIVCNRPDNEEHGQTPFSKIRSLARAVQIDAVHIPFLENQMTAQDIDQLANLLKTNQKIHMYSRTGAGSSTLWAMSAFELGYKESAIIEHVVRAGYRLDQATLENLISSKVGHRC